MTVAVIGAGRMGGPIVGRLVAAGHDPVVLTRRPESREAAEKSRWRCADTVEGAVQNAVRPVLESYASPIMSVGPVGNGQRIKLINNALFVAQVGLALDAIRVAGELGISEEQIVDAVRQGSDRLRPPGALGCLPATALSAKLPDLAPS